MREKNLYLSLCHKACGSSSLIESRECFVVKLNIRSLIFPIHSEREKKSLLVNWSVCLCLWL
jgi:hypothetical protein